jgi:hypothetical protein
MTAATCTHLPALPALVKVVTAHLQCADLDIVVDLVQGTKLLLLLVVVDCCHQDHHCNRCHDGCTLHSTQCMYVRDAAR